jgi:hypothetical protein
MSNGRGAAEGNGTAVLAVSTTMLTKHLAGAVLLLGLAGFFTQSLGLATGRDFVFGLIPKFNPAGTRNIPVWFAAAAFAACAVFATVTALAHRPSGYPAGRRWSALAVMFLVLSAERLGSVIAGIERLASGSGAGSLPPTILTGLTSAVAVVVYGWCIFDLPRRIQAHFVSAAAAFASGVALCAFAPFAQRADALDLRITHMLMMSAGRLLELAGVTLFLEAVAVHLRSRFEEIRVVVDSRSARLLMSQTVTDALVIRLSPGRIRSVLTTATLVLLAASLAAALAREIAGWEIEALYRVLVVDFEGNLPTWYSSLLLLACAVFLACVAAARHHALDQQWRSWAMVGLLFAGMSADEAAGLHELSVHPLRAIVDDNPWLRYPLILPGLIVATLVLGFFARFFRSLPSETRRSIFLGLGAILLGALGIETMGGWFDPELYGPSVTYVLLSTIEEGLEMTGAIVVLGAVMRHIEHHIGTLRIPGGQPTPSSTVRLDHPANIRVD